MNDPFLFLFPRHTPSDSAGRTAHESNDTHTSHFSVLMLSCVPRVTVGSKALIVPDEQKSDRTPARLIAQEPALWRDSN